MATTTARMRTAHVRRIDVNGEIVFVRGFARLAEHLGALGAHRVLILAPPSRRFVDELVTALAAFSPVVFDGARVHVPLEVVDAAETALAACDADTIVAIGGGSPIGLGKALRLRRDVRFVALPTTYAGSEMTTMFGITTGATKQTGRDPRVRPDLIVYDVELTRALPLALTVQSLVNALAHVISAMSTGSLAPTDTATLDAAASVTRALDALLLDPDDLAARTDAQRAASACAAAYERGKAGIQHALAHLLGGALRLDHAALHAVLLPPFVANLRIAQPALVATLSRAIAKPDFAAYLYDTLARSGAPVSLAALGATRDAVAAALATRPDLPASIVMAAFAGERPS